MAVNVLIHSLGLRDLHSIKKYFIAQFDSCCELFENIRFDI